MVNKSFLSPAGGQQTAWDGSADHHPPPPSPCCLTHRVCRAPPPPLSPLRRLPSCGAVVSGGHLSGLTGALQAGPSAPLSRAIS